MIPRLPPAGKSSEWPKKQSHDRIPNLSNGLERRLSLHVSEENLSSFNWQVFAKISSTEHQKFKYRASLLEQRNAQENSFYLIIRESCIKKFPGFTKFEVTGSMGWGKTFNSSVFCSQNTIRQLQTRKCCISQLAPGKKLYLKHVLCKQPTS